MENIEFRRKLKIGDPEAFSQLFKLFHSRLLGYCNLFVHDKNLSEDFVQDCFIKLWENHDKIIPEKSVEALLFVMARNKCFAYLKDRKIQNSEVSLDAISINQLQYLYQIDFLRKEELSIEERIIDALKQAIANLPEKRKAVFLMHKIEGIKQKEIAEKLGITIKAVEKHLSEAKRDLQKKLTEEYPAYAIMICILLETIN
jgi:RNA polymerase sigma-70 factor (ECF subfamily)